MTQVTDDAPQYDDDGNEAAKQYDVQAYQDELDTSPEKTDPLMNEMNDDPVVTFGVPSDELRDELDKRDLDNPDTTDDMRSEIEDFDDGQGKRD